MTTPPELKMSLSVSAARQIQLADNVTSILHRIQAATPKSSRNSKPVRLVCISKLKPANDILALHQSAHQQLHFGENYQQELLEKSMLLPREIRWHFIGALQTNKCKPLAEQIPNLWCVESIDTIKKVDLLEKGRALVVEKDKELKGTPLRVFVQVNTSGEKEKSGAEPEDTLALCKHVTEHCKYLKLQGLMTIGALARSKEADEGKENEDFIRLRDIRNNVAKELGIKEEELELSMGMSQDFESAIRCGSDEVRIGSTIFGQRPGKKDSIIKEEVEEGKI